MKCCDPLNELTKFRSMSNSVNENKDELASGCTMTGRRRAGGVNTSRSPVQLEEADEGGGDRIRRRRAARGIQAVFGFA